MQVFASLVGIAAALAVGAVSPGPSFVMVARTTAIGSRSAGLAAAFGMGSGAVVFAVSALLGLQGLLEAVPALYLALKLLGGAYLVLLGVRIWRSADQPLALDAHARGDTRSTVGSSYAWALTTQLCNPKAAIIYASVFAAFLPADASLAFDAAVVTLVFVIETGWYAIVALALSARRPRAAYLRFKARIDRLAGGVMAALGLGLAWSARRL